MNQVKNGKPLRKTNLSRHWDIFFVSFALDYGSKWHRLVCTLKNPFHCFRRPFSIFLKFIPAVDFFTGIIVCSGQALTRLLCAFSDGSIPREGDVVRIFAYTAINSSILLVTAMSVDRFTAVVFPLFYLRKVKQRSLVFISTGLVIFSAIFAAL